MGVTITIAANDKFCRDNGLTTVEKEECFCDGKGCEFCEMKGFYEMESRPFEMNVTCANFATLWNSLGLQFDGENDWCGEIAPHAVLSVLRTMDPALLLKETRVEGNMTSFGTGEERAARYLNGLREIANEAERREENIVWY